MKKIILLLLINFSMASETIEWNINQTKVYFVHNTEIPMIDVAMTFRAGSRYATPGLANFTAQSTMLGSKFLNKEQINAKLSSVGSKMHAFTDDELVIYHLRSLSDVSVNTLTDQFSSAIFNAAFPSQEIRYQRQSILSEIDFEQVQPEEIAQEHMFKFLFPSAPRLNSSVNGYTDTLNNLHTSDLLQYHAKLIGQQNATIIIIGDMSEDNAKKLAESLSNKIKKNKETLVKETLNKTNEPQTIAIQPEQPQTYFLFTTKISTPSTDKAFVTHLLLNEVLGGNSSSYLFQTLRDQEGLVYNVRSEFKNIDDFALLSISGQTKTKNTHLINKLLENAFESKKDTILTQKRFNIAKESLKNKLMLQSGTNGDRLRSIIKIAKDNHPVDYDIWLKRTLESITIKDVSQALESIHANQFYKVYVGC